MKAAKIIGYVLAFVNLGAALVQAWEGHPVATLVLGSLSYVTYVLARVLKC